MVLGLAIAAVFLVAAVGSASAEHACVADSGAAFFCNDTVTESCTLNGTMNCPATENGLVVGGELNGAMKGRGMPGFNDECHSLSNTGHTTP